MDRHKNYLKITLNAASTGYKLMFCLCRSQAWHMQRVVSGRALNTKLLRHLKQIKGEDGYMDRWTDEIIAWFSEYTPNSQEFQTGPPLIVYR